MVKWETLLRETDPHPCFETFSLFFMQYFTVKKNIEDVTQVAYTLDLKKLQHYIQNVFLKTYTRDHSLIIGQNSLTALKIAEKYGMSSYLTKQSIFSCRLVVLDYIVDPSFDALSKEVRYELLKNTIIHQLVSDSDYGSEDEYIRTADGMEIRIIFNFLDLVVHENRTADLVPQKKLILRPRDGFSTSSERNLDLDSISCNKESDDCVTLVVEGKEIYVSSFLLTNNSPVFRAMLRSKSFKEGQSKRIELPGKKFNQILYFLQYLYSPNEIKSFHRKLDLLSRKS